MQLVKARLAAGEAPQGWVGHVHLATAALVADTAWRPQDLRAVAPGVIASAGAAREQALQSGGGGGGGGGGGELPDAQQQVRPPCC